MTPPRDLSAKSKSFWQRVHNAVTADGRRRVFNDADDELLERGLRRFDLADELLRQAREAGFTTNAGRGLLAASRDAEMAGLKLITAIGLTKDDAAAPRRPGRPADREWSAMRGGRAS